VVSYSKGENFKLSILNTPLQLSCHTVQDQDRRLKYNPSPVVTGTSHATGNRKYIYLPVNTAVWPVSGIKRHWLWFSVLQWYRNDRNNSDHSTLCENTTTAFSHQLL